MDPSSPCEGGGRGSGHLWSHSPKPGRCEVEIAAAYQAVLQQVGGAVCPSPDQAGQWRGPVGAHARRAFVRHHRIRRLACVYPTVLITLKSTNCKVSHPKLQETMSFTGLRSTAVGTSSTSRERNRSRCRASPECWAAHGCRNGRGGACAAGLLSGEVSYHGAPPARSKRSVRASACLPGILPATGTLCEVETPRSPRVKLLPVRVHAVDHLTHDVVRPVEASGNQRLRFGPGSIWISCRRPAACLLANAPFDDEFIELHIITSTAATPPTGCSTR